jgi:hypothetical protein
MADRAGNVEGLGFDKQWAEAGLQEYGRNVFYLNRFGTGTQARLPLRRFARPVLTHSRAEQSLMRLNEYRSRYHHPGGLQYAGRLDFAGVLNSAPKDTAGYVDTEIRQNPGYFGHGF